MKKVIYLFLFLSVQAMSAIASTPESVALQAFELQREGKYKEMCAVYDETDLNKLAGLFQDSISKEVTRDPEKQQFLVSTFGTAKLETLEAMPAEEVMGSLFKFLFEARLTKEEKQLLDASEFRLMRTELITSSESIVHYQVEFHTPNGTVLSKPKQMRLRLQGEEWQILIDPAIIAAVKQVLDAVAN